MRILLDVVKGPHTGRRFEFAGHDNFIVGRASFAHFRLAEKDPLISRVHFLIEVNPPQCRLLDMGSRNGTKVNGKVVRAIDLRHGDLIRSGHTDLEVSFSEPAAVAAAGPKEGLPVGTPALKPFDPNVAGTNSFQAGPTIEGYQILGELGRGGMGVVYLANRVPDRERVAVKTIQPAAAGSADEVARFLREAEILRQLRHPYIVSFHELGQADELLYFVMDYVPGADASRLLRRDGPMEVGRAVRLVCQVLEALQYSHALGFVHRDVKPSNLLVSGDPGFEVCKLADFGLARVYHMSPLSGLTVLGNVGGTLPYMPPEQITDYRNVSPAVDIYATAATLYRLLTRHYVFDFADLPLERRLTKVLSDEPVPIRQRQSTIPGALADTIHRALAREPGSRFPDARAFRDAMLPFAADE